VRRVVAPGTRSGGAESASERRARAILERVRAVPEGFVRTYGDISPGAPRLAGSVLAGCDDPSLPWHRIVRADGSLAKGERQRRRLHREGVPFRGPRVDMRVARMLLFGEEPMRGDPPASGEEPAPGDPPASGEEAMRGDPLASGEEPATGDPPASGEEPA